MTDADPCPARASADEIDLRLTDGWIRDYADTCRVPLEVDRVLLARGTRDAARVFVDAVPDRVVRSEVEALRCAANKREVEKTAEMLAGLSKRARTMLAGRHLRVVDGGAERTLKFPTSDQIQAAATRRAAFEHVLRFTTFGGYWDTDGQKRQSGRQSYTFHHYLFAPIVERKSGRPINEVAIELALNMRLAFIGAHNRGSEPPRTSNRRYPSYFALFMEHVLWELGVPTSEIDPVGAIIAFDQRRKRKP